VALAVAAPASIPVSFEMTDHENGRPPSVGSDQQAAGGVQLRFYKSMICWSVAVRRTALWTLPALTLVLACSTDTTIAPASRQESAVTAMETNYSFSVTPADRTVHVRFARARSDGAESVSDFMRRVFVSADAAAATRLVLDLSEMKGGDSFLLVPLLKGILAHEQFRRRGGLVVILGPNSFAQSQNAATLLKQYAQPIFVDRPAI